MSVKIVWPWVVPPTGPRPKFYYYTGCSESPSLHHPSAPHERVYFRIWKISGKNITVILHNDSYDYTPDAWHLFPQNLNPAMYSRSIGPREAGSNTTDPSVGSFFVGRVSIYHGGWKRVLYVSKYPCRASVVLGYSAMLCFKPSKV